MLRKSLSTLVLLFFCVTALWASRPPAFGVKAHSDVNIEWWYVNAHITTDTGRHLALIGAFFRFGNGVSLLDPLAAAPRAHYLIYAVTDLDRKTHVSYSLADTNMVALLKQIAPLLAAAQPRSKGAQALLAALQQGRLPSGNTLISGKADIVNSPFHIAYGSADTITADNAADTAFTIDLGSGTADKIHLRLNSLVPPMAVGGNGETGLSKPSDMYYYSLTRCAVSGTIDTGTGPETITGGVGWFDHQWGNSWVAHNDGWDWFGVQLENDTQILFFRQRSLSTGRVYYPLATFMDKQGQISVTKDLVFTPDPKSDWTSPNTGVTYPLSWTVKFPARNLTLHIHASVKDQEMQILGPGGAIWEGACTVTAEDGPVGRSGKAAERSNRQVKGVAYMELVGYNSPAVKAHILRTP